MFYGIVYFKKELTPHTSLIHLHHMILFQVHQRVTQEYDNFTATLSEKLTKSVLAAKQRATDSLCQSIKESTLEAEKELDEEYKVRCCSLFSVECSTLTTACLLIQARLVTALTAEQQQLEQRAHTELEQRRTRLQSEENEALASLREQQQSHFASRTAELETKLQNDRKAALLAIEQQRVECEETLAQFSCTVKGEIQDEAQRVGQSKRLLKEEFAAKEKAERAVFELEMEAQQAHLRADEASLEETAEQVTIILL